MNSLAFGCGRGILQPLMNAPASPIHLLGDGDEEKLLDLLLREAEKRDQNRRIRCPRCHCGHIWNTFDTHARCPSCGFQWRETQCLSCAAFSQHDDWYERNDRPS